MLFHFPSDLSNLYFDKSKIKKNDQYINNQISLNPNINMNHKRYCPAGCLHVLTDAWQCLVKFTQSDVDSTVEYITGVFLFYDNEYNNEAIREKEVFFKTAVLIDDVRSNVILTDQHMDSW